MIESMIVSLDPELSDDRETPHSRPFANTNFLVVLLLAGRLWLYH
jgi:hypothetical protein